jgi:hypothetical protein
MPLSRVFDYGTCPCGGKYDNHMVEVRIKGVGDEPVLKNVPQGVCPVCGGRVYKAQVLERIEAIFRGTQTAAKETPVPV